MTTAKNTSQDISILFAEDDEADYNLLKILLDENFPEARLLRAHNGEELLRFLKTAKSFPSLILLDLNMPLKDGRQTLFEMKENPVWKKIPVIVLSTSSAPPDRKFVENLGANFVTKPFSIDHYILFIRAIAASHRTGFKKFEYTAPGQ